MYNPFFNGGNCVNIADLRLHGIHVFKRFIYGIRQYSFYKRDKYVVKHIIHIVN